MNQNKTSSPIVAKTEEAGAMVLLMTALSTGLFFLVVDLIWLGFVATILQPWSNAWRV